MRTITLHTLTFRNWRGEKERTTELNVGLPTFICGGNGLGKSRHFDAFCWLLFGKDRFDRKDFELRTHDEQGNVLHHCECSVEAVISIDGAAHTLKREFKEQWVKPRGQAEEVFKGNITECTWDGTPVKVGEYQSRVASCIMDDTLFKMLTNPRYFTEQMPWKAQRECLMQMAGTVTDEEIAATKPEFQLLLDTLAGKSLGDYRRELAAQKKRLKASLAEVQPRIDQTQKMMPEAEDWVAIDAQVQELNAQVADIDNQLTSADERVKAGAGERKKMQQRIFDLQAEQRAIVEARKQQAEADAYAHNEERRSIEARLKTAHSERSQVNIDIKRAQDREAYLEKEIASFDKQLARMRDDWRAANAMTYDGSDACPHCGQRLPEGMLAQAHEKFAQHKAALLAKNVEQGRALKAQQKAYTDELEQKKREAADLQQAATAKDAEIKALYDDLQAHPAVTAQAVEPKEIAEWTDKQAEVDQLRAQLEAPDVTRDTAVQDGIAELRARRGAVVAEIDVLKDKLARRGQIERANAEIARLQDEGRKLAQQIADCEKSEFTAAEFSRKKIEDCEARINNMFERVRFQLFETTLDGNEFETCIPLVDGTPYGVANTASQVNAGLDIIRTLCRFHNVTAPIFIDGAESINKFLQVPSQIIFLQVTTDKELVIK